jgi:transcriptional regulator with XRE-family HTH domain
MRVTDELKKLRQRAGLSMADMAKHMGYKTPSGYQRYESSSDFTKEYFSVIFTNKLMRALQGRGNPPISPGEIYRLCGAILPGEEEEAFFGASLSFRVPIFLLDQLDLQSLDLHSEGEPSDLLSFLQFTTAENVEEGAFCVEITDDSMSSSQKNEVSFEEGDRIICDREASIKPGDFVIAKRDADKTVVFRRYRLVGYDRSGDSLVELIPLNPHYPTLRLDSGTPGQIVARVQELRKRL